VNSILVEVTRGSLVESVHRGAVALVDATGALVWSVGDVGRPIYPRSALKPVQALPLLESGAAEAFGLGDEEVALACASHSGEPMHVDRVRAWLRRIGCSAGDLACGAHELRDEVREAMRARGETVTPVHNNCSGKHTGFLSVARHGGHPTAGYTDVRHPVQRAVADAIRELGGLSGELPWGVDGCTAPNFAVPLTALARMMAQLADPGRQPPARARALRRILASMSAHPELVAGTGRICTLLMRQGKGRFVMKTGAEGVFVAVLPERGLGLALKIDDGATRAAESLIANLLIGLGALPDSGAAHGYSHAPVRDTRGNVVGERRAAAELHLASVGMTGAV
jgi:L-asparaginase II